MGCQVHCLNPQLLYQKGIPDGNKSKQQSSSFLIQPNSKFFRSNFFSSYNNLNEQQPVSTSTIKQRQIPVSDVKFKTLGACKLGISRYPDFEYNAEGGAGSGTGTEITDSDPNGTDFSIDFDIKTMYIPPLSSATTKFLGLPLPPFLRIDIVPEAFQGTINQESGKVDLKFKAKFCFSAGSFYRAPPLLVETVLTSEESNGDIRKGKGERLDKDGKCRLVGVAKVEPINDFFMDTFLSLPTECLAELNAVISLTGSV